MMNFYEIFIWNLKIQIRSNRIYSTLSPVFFGLLLIIFINLTEKDNPPPLDLYLITIVIGGVWSMNATSLNLIGMESALWPVRLMSTSNVGRFLTSQSLAHGLLVTLCIVPTMTYFLMKGEISNSQKGMMLSLFFLSLPLKIIQSLYVSIYRNFYQDKLFSSQFVPPSFAPLLVLVTDVLVLIGCFLGIYYYKEAKATVIFSVIFGVIVICFFISNLNIKLAARLLYKRRFTIYKNIQKRD